MIHNKFNDAVNKINHSLKDREIYSLQLISHLIQKSYIPFNTMTLDPYCLAFILNEIIINDRRCIIEFGTGISTVYMATLMKLNKLDCKFYSVDHDEAWSKKINSLLINESVEEKVKLIHSPLVKNTDWYDQEILNLSIDGNDFFDMAIIDGPPAYNQSMEESRYGALPFIFPRLSKNSFSIFVDDVSRPGEIKVLKKWLDEFKLNFKIYHKRLGICTYGNHYESCPL